MKQALGVTKYLPCPEDEELKLYHKRRMAEKGLFQAKDGTSRLSLEKMRFTDKG